MAKASGKFAGVLQDETNQCREYIIFILEAKVRGTNFVNAITPSKQ